jgi:hypothetical protein
MGMHSPHSRLLFLITVEHLDDTRDAQIQQTGSNSTIAAANPTMYGCHVIRITSVTSLNAVQNAPIRALVSTSLHTTGCARIFEKKVGSLQFSNSHFSSSKRIQARLYAVYRAPRQSRPAAALTTDTNMETVPLTMSERAPFPNTKSIFCLSSLMDRNSGIAC